MISSREDIKNFILSIERNYLVNSWKANNIHLWPLIRVRLFFTLINKTEDSGQFEKQLLESTAKKDVPVFTKRQKIKLLISSFLKKSRDYYNYKNWLKSLKSVDNVYVGHDSFRVNYKDRRFNRFFDVLIKENDSNYLFIDHDKLPIENKYNSGNFLDFHKIFQSYKRTKKHRTYVFTWEGYDNFLKHLTGSEFTNNLVPLFLKEELESSLKSSFLPKIMFFKDVFTQIRAKKLHVLCYYNETVMAMIGAANQIGIETIEQQHGPQTAIHMAYANWSKLPSEGYMVLPRIFWCWDIDSKNTLDDWVMQHTLYSTKVTGNPWVDYWKIKTQTYPFKDYILYSLQPRPLTMAELLPDALIDVIKKQPYKWFLRLHPRQFHDKENIVDYLVLKKVLHLINIEEASQDPLPLLLANAKIHVTHFSGTTIEANLFEKKTILLNHLGVKSFPELIAKGKASYIQPTKNSFENEFLSYLDSIE